MSDGAHTHHGHGSGGLGLALSIAAGLVLADVLRAILPVLLIGVAVMAGLVVLGLVARVVTAWPRQDAIPLTCQPVHRPLEAGSDEPAQMVTTRTTRAGPPELHQHLHFHGLDAAQVAAILAAQHNQAAHREGDAR